MPNAQVWDCTPRAYHADTTRQGSTMLKELLESPQMYHDLYVSKLMDQEPSEALTVGNALHTLVLEPSKFDERFAIEPEVNKRTNEGKATLAKWRADNLNKDWLSPSNKLPANDMATAILRNKDVIRWLSQGVVERAITWEHDGVLLKCRPDLFVPQPNEPADVYLDIKTAANPTRENWNKPWGPMNEFRYDLQVAAMYPMGIEELTGRPCLSGVIVVGKNPPHDVYIHETSRWRNLGTQWLERALWLLQTCAESGVWQRDDQLKPSVLDEPPAYLSPRYARNGNDDVP